MSIMKYNFLAVCYILVIIGLAHYFSPPEYDWKNNTISELAAQGYANKWIMQLGFAGFGGILAAGCALTLWNHPGSWMTRLPILIYAVSVLLTGIFCTKPFIENLTYSTTESGVHSLFAQIAGVAFSVGLLAFALKEQANQKKLYHFLFFIAVITCSILFGMLSQYHGIAQRILYAVSFTWLVFYYEEGEIENDEGCGRERTVYKAGWEKSACLSCPFDAGEA